MSEERVKEACDTIFHFSSLTLAFSEVKRYTREKKKANCCEWISNSCLNDLQRIICYEVPYKSKFSRATQGLITGKRNATVTVTCVMNGRVRGRNHSSLTTVKQNQRKERRKSEREWERRKKRAPVKEKSSASKWTDDADASTDELEGEESWEKCSNELWTMVQMVISQCHTVYQSHCLLLSRSWHKWRRHSLKLALFFLGASLSLYFFLLSFSSALSLSLSRRANFIHSRSFSAVKLAIHSGRAVIYYAQPSFPLSRRNYYWTAFANA